MPIRARVSDAENTSQPGTASSAQSAGQPSRPPPMRAPSKRIVSGQSKTSGFTGGRDGADGVGERRHAGEEDPARPGERLLGLEHQGELEEVEPADMDEGAGAGFRRDPAGMREGVAGLAQGDERVGRRQVERRFAPSGR